MRLGPRDSNVRVERDHLDQAQSERRASDNAETHDDLAPGLRISWRQGEERPRTNDRHSTWCDRTSKGGFLHVQHRACHLRPAQEQMGALGAAWRWLDRYRLAQIALGRLEQSFRRREQLRVECLRGARRAERHVQVKITRPPIAFWQRNFLDNDDSVGAHLEANPRNAGQRGQGRRMREWQK
jgi:hypothetical protein